MYLNDLQKSLDLKSGTDENIKVEIENTINELRKINEEINTFISKENNVVDNVEFDKSTNKSNLALDKFSKIDLNELSDNDKFDKETMNEILDVLSNVQEVYEIDDEKLAENIQKFVDELSSKNNEYTQDANKIVQNIQNLQQEVKQYLRDLSNTPPK